MPSILRQIVRICRSLFKCNYFKNEQLFLGFLFHFWNLNEIWNIFRKRKIVIANVNLKLQTVKGLVRPLSKKCRFEISFDSQYVKWAQTILKSAWQHFYDIFPSLWGEMISKISLLLKFEIIGVFVNTLAVPLPIQLS